MHNELHARAEEWFETDDADVCTGDGWRVEIIRPKRKKTPNMHSTSP